MIIKDNECAVIFTCSKNFQDCVYRDGKEGCKYKINNLCCSKVASVNRMVLELKNLGIETTTTRKENLD